jgi:hypothetical protein
VCQVSKWGLPYKIVASKLTIRKFLNMLAVYIEGVWHSPICYFDTNRKKLISIVFNKSFFNNLFATGTLYRYYFCSKLNLFIHAWLHRFEEKKTFWNCMIYMAFIIICSAIFLWLVFSGVNVFSYTFPPALVKILSKSSRTVYKIKNMQ